jgi:DNA-binding transcriptional MocR family regulator
MVSEPVRYQLSGTSAAAISDSVEEQIRTGRLRPADRLPPVRTLAAQLGVSPGTVAAAYGTLRLRGLTVGDGRRGTRVAGRPAVAGQPPLAAPPALAVVTGSGHDVLDLASGNPDLALLPDLRDYLPALAAQPAAGINRLYGAPSHLPALTSLAAQQLGADGVPTGHLTVVSGALDGIERVLASRLRPGDRVAIEDPGYPAVLDLVGALGLQAVAVGVDDEGLDPDHLEAVLGRGTAAVVFSPRAQNPTGAFLSDRRAAALRELLGRFPAVLTVEDDHAGPVAGAAYRTVADPQRDRWAVLRSVSKSLGPDLRLAVLSADPTTASRVEGHHRLGAGWVSHLLQQLVVELWSDPAVTAILQRAAAEYGRRRLALIEALAAQGIPAYGRSGLNVWVPVPSEHDVVATLRDASVSVMAGERFRLHTGPAIRITTARLNPSDGPAVAALVARAVATAPGPRLG